MTESLEPARRRFTSLAIVLSITCLILSGCGGDARVAPVHGLITLDGKPVDQASVTFAPKSGGRPAYGITAADGTFKLTTFDTNDGALIGMHSVTVRAVDVIQSAKSKAMQEEFGSLADSMPGGAAKQVWRVPERYSIPGKSELEFEVAKVKVNEPQFELSGSAK